MGRLTQADREYFGYKGELNIRFGMEYGRISFYETPQPADNVSVFTTFDDAKKSALIAYKEHKKQIIANLEESEQKLFEVTEDTVLGYNPDGGW